MISSEVQRTLVKSPPELWAELSDPAALARHLGELGEIRIVRTEPERVVEWAAENTTGTVSIKPSGWGTKVTLSVTRELGVATPAGAAEAAAPDELDAAAPDELGAATGDELDSSATAETAESQDVVEPETAAEEDAVPDQSPDVVQGPAIASGPETVAVAPETASESEILAAEPVAEPEPRRGFFARLFGRRRREASTGPAVETIAVAPADPRAVAESAPAIPDTPAVPDASTLDACPMPDAFAAVRQVLEPETFAAEHPFAAVPEVKQLQQPTPEPAVTEPAPSGHPQQTGDIAAELLAAEEAGAEEVTAVLTAVLDRLGAAPHRPFSRS
jgi:hypothetical protein